ncbi:PREDICTED: 1,2-dihydroxy-3-keto-5-methylthiopentene dioxygenase-like [Acropora digitifera]|uniref:1,2-dihydroxy-3-keto-5-methylthiopentene dioxygenase-like n=1 Tax=Acropora digitifera TaxID=70779 RepID=UPI00077AEDF7|nr:PREDICTED: 1,2-dihydroxy-3-keto-5-methylthiopentene dioxygenase-like [Acropora digitifera]
MVSAWFMDSSDEDQRLSHQLDPPQPVSLEDLANCGVLYWKVSFFSLIYTRQNNLYEKEIVDVNCNGIIPQIICSDVFLPHLFQLKSFFEEHLHSDEEIRFILDGSGYFDIRNYDDKWIRIQVEKGDLIILPAGIYHRFTLDDKDYIKAMRLFIGEPVWTPHNRPADDHPARADYIRKIKDGRYA